jgi:hypothetical protein
VNTCHYAHCEKDFVHEPVMIPGETFWVANPEGRRTFCSEDCMNNYSEAQASAMAEAGNSYRMAEGVDMSMINRSPVAACVCATCLAGPHAFRPVWRWREAPYIVSARCICRGWIDDARHIDRHASRTHIYRQLQQGAAS